MQTRHPEAGDCRCCGCECCWTHAPPFHPDPVRETHPAAAAAVRAQKLLSSPDSPVLLLCLQLCFRIGYHGSASYIWPHGQHFLNESLWLWYLSYTPFILVCNVSGSLRLRGQYSGTVTLSLGPMVLMASHPLARTHGNKPYLIWLMVWCQ